MTLRIVIFFLVAKLAASANPISGYLIFPPHTMVAENVLVGVTETGAVVSGTYRLRVTPDAPEHWRGPPYTLAIQLPVPIPASLRRFEDIEAAVHPFMTVKGTRYQPEKSVFYYDVPSLPKEAKLAVFYFHVRRTDLEQEFDLSIQYDQPVIAVESREVVFYVPFLPSFDRYQKQLDLRRDSYLITFESYGATRLRLAGAVTQLERSDPRLISVRPRHREVIAVERVGGRTVEVRQEPNQSPEPTPGTVTPRATVPKLE